MKPQIEMIFLKRKESIIVNILIICAVVLFFIPALLIVALRMIFKIFQVFKTPFVVPASSNGILKKVIN